MKENILEAVIGGIVLVVVLFLMCVAYFASGAKVKDGYVLIARFDDVGGISVGSDVKLNGMKVGTIKNLYIDTNYQVKAELLLKNEIRIPNDSAASIVTDGIMGNKFVGISVGFSTEKFKPGDEI
ncbi:MAG: MlaD family protein [Holosporales bacterium]|jgi:phospholipid/cholesterol/gamma-HCH transport system substrate-binding protein|nr:MlaD family protein [Holosporales bacterium]